MSQGLNLKKSAQYIYKPMFTAFTTFMKANKLSLDQLYFEDMFKAKYSPCIQVFFLTKL